MSKRLTVLRILSVRCDEIIPLVSESFDHDLTRMQKLAMHTHLFCCRSCRKVRKHLAMLRETARKIREDADLALIDTSACLSPEAKERMRRRMNV